MEAILNAGHIPAGMELFAAGDQSQMEVIRYWIDESDVYLLILGGRYDTIEPESGKSYIHLEYEYAIERGKPHFVLVITDKGLDDKIEKEKRLVLEQDNNKEFKAFKQLVTAQKLVRFWADLRDIKYFILESLNEFEKRENLIGWIKGDQAVDSGEIAEQLARLSKENAELREINSELSEKSNGPFFNGLSYKELYDILLNEPIFESNIKDEILKSEISNVATLFGDNKMGMIHLFWFLGEKIWNYDSYFPFLSKYGDPLKQALGELNFGILHTYGLFVNYNFTETGKAFFLKLRKEKIVLKTQ